MTLVQPGTIRDTVSDGGWAPLQITVTLDEPLVGDLSRPITGDGALAWCAYLEHTHAHGTAHLPPMRPARSALDFDLGLATWTRDPTGPVIDDDALGADGKAWGFACSHHHPVPAALTAVAVRRKPADGPMVRYTRERRHHLGAGPHKARDTIHPAAWIGDITWHAVGDPDRVSSLLTRLTHIGRLGRHGYGRVARVLVVRGGERDAWRDRTLPAAAGTVDGIRAPYHHQTRQMPCRPAS